MNEDWQKVVTGLIDNARLIIIVCGQSDGVRWEIKEVLRQRERAAKTIFINPTPNRPDVFGSAVGMVFPAVPNKRLIAVVVDDGGTCPIWSSLGEDVDYEIAIQWMARKLALVKGPPAAPNRVG
jgi:hypothetical protein